MIEIDGFKWKPEMQSWVDKDGKYASHEEHARLETRRQEEDSRKIMQRLAEAESIFASMSGPRERKAAHSWLKEHFNL